MNSKHEEKTSNVDNQPSPTHSVLELEPPNNGQDMAEGSNREKLQADDDQKKSGVEDKSGVDQ